MVVKTTTIAIILLIIGILLLFLSVKKQVVKKQLIKKNSHIQKIQNIDKTLDEKQYLNEIVKILKNYLHQTFKIKEKLALTEISKELQKLQQKKLTTICEKISQYQFTGQTPTKSTNQILIQEILQEITRIERERKIKIKQLKKQQTLHEKIQIKQQEIKEKIRIEKIKHSKIKNAKTNLPRR